MKCIHEGARVTKYYAPPAKPIVSHHNEWSSSIEKIYLGVTTEVTECICGYRNTNQYLGKEIL